MVSKTPIPHRTPHEEPNYSGGTPERHAPRGEGTMKDGTVMVNRTYKQPWVEQDGVCDHKGDDKTG